MGGLSAESARKADTRFETMVDESFAVLLPNGEDFNLAQKYLGCLERRLRAGEALHLTIATNRRAEELFSLDKML